MSTPCVADLPQANWLVTGSGAYAFAITIDALQARGMLLSASLGTDGDWCATCVDDTEGEALQEALGVVADTLIAIDPITKAYVNMTILLEGTPPIMFVVYQPNQPLQKALCNWRLRFRVDDSSLADSDLFRFNVRASAEVKT